MKFKPGLYGGRLEFFTKHLPQQPGRVLDVGNLGDGASYTTEIQKLVTSRGGKYVGMDSNKVLADKLGHENQVYGDLHKVPLEDASFDVVYAGEIIEHTWDPLQMIRECRRILKPGGLLILDTPNVYNLSTLIALTFKGDSPLGDDAALARAEALGEFERKAQGGEALLQPQHKIFFTPAMMEQLLRWQGFAVNAWGTTKKGTAFHKLVISIFPQLGNHLCVCARKTTVEEAFDGTPKAA